MPCIFCFQLLEYNEILLVSAQLLDFGFCTDCCRHHFVLKSGDGGHTSSDQLKKKKNYKTFVFKICTACFRRLSAVRVDNYGENCIIIASTFISSHLLINIALCTLFLLSTNLKG